MQNIRVSQKMSKNVGLSFRKIFFAQNYYITRYGYEPNCMVVKQQIISRALSPHPQGVEGIASGQSQIFKSIKQ